MFWGLILEAGKRYSQKVVKSFHVSMATLEFYPHTDNDNVPVMLEYEDGREYLLCNLNKNKSMQCHLDLNFKAGETIGFYSASGKSRVHMTGYLLEELEDFDSSADEDEEEEDEAVAPSSNLKRKEVTVGQAGGKKKKLVEADEESDDDEDDDEEGEEEEEDEEEDDDDEDEEDSDDLISPVKKKGKDIKPNMNESTSNEKKKKKEVLEQVKDKKPRDQNGQLNTSQSKPSKKNKQGETQSPSNSKELQGGVTIEDKVIGKGPVARAGNKITVYYVGRLKANDKQFDSCLNGPGFRFNLGRGEVIKGWDVGVLGMRVGGKRTISVPAGMAYGRKGQPPVIPPHSALVFDVELRSVN